MYLFYYFFFINLFFYSFSKNIHKFFFSATSPAIQPDIFMYIRILPACSANHFIYLSFICFPLLRKGNHSIFSSIWRSDLAETQHMFWLSVRLEESQLFEDPNMYRLLNYNTLSRSRPLSLTAKSRNFKRIVKCKLISNSWRLFKVFSNQIEDCMKC